jgi:hypothetical protein
MLLVSNARTFGLAAVLISCASLFLLAHRFDVSPARLVEKHISRVCESVSYGRFSPRPGLRILHLIDRPTEEAVMDRCVYDAMVLRTGRRLRPDGSRGHTRASSPSETS